MRIPALIAACILAGCSSAPPTAESTLAKASEPAAVADATSASDGAQPKFQPPPGYKVKIHEWDVVYCKKMQLLGSRFPKEVCMTEPELKEHMAANARMRGDVERVQRTCTSQIGCGTLP